MSNEGNADLNVDYTIDYRLPSLLTFRPLQVAESRGAELPVVRYAKAEVKAEESAWKAEDNNALSLSYANDYTAYTGSDNIYVNYAHYYPGNALKRRRHEAFRPSTFTWLLLHAAVRGSMEGSRNAVYEWRQAAV